MEWLGRTFVDNVLLGRPRHAAVAISVPVAATHRGILLGAHLRREVAGANTRAHASLAKTKSTFGAVHVRGATKGGGTRLVGTRADRLD